MAVIVLHGGPGAQGSADALADGLRARGWDARAPHQRRSGGEPLTVAIHVDDLVVAPGDVLVGCSWGATLALAFAAAHPGVARALVLIGSATFDRAARDEFRARMAAGARYDVDADPPDDTPLDRRGNREAWDDYLRLEDAGVYPAAFARVRVPVLLLHGADDPHPGALIARSLRAVMPQLEYVELARCGHEPWRERGARDAFYATLCAYLERCS